MIRTTCKLSTLTPCHVGSGNILLRNQEFVVDGDDLGIIDPRKIYDILGERGIDLWCRAIENRDDIYAMLRNMKHDIRLQHICSRIMPYYGGSARVMELREQLMSSGSAVIPGSSIKGAIVTAILARDPQDPKLKIGPLQKMHNCVVDHFFAVPDNKYDPKSSSLRFLRVGDACFEHIPTCAVHCLSLNIRSSHDSLVDDKVRQFVECIYAEDSATCEIDLINPNSNYYHDVVPYVKSIPEELTSIEALFRCLTAHTRSLLVEERDFWRNYDADELNDYLPQINDLISECDACKDGRSAILRVGYGSGWNFITGAWSRRQTERQNPDQWANILTMVRKDRMGRYGKYPYIKTRRVFYDRAEDPILPLGFMKIEIA